MTRWIDRARGCADRYQDNRRELGRMRRYDRKKRPGLAAPKIEDEREARQKLLFEEIRAVEWAMAQLEKMERDEKSQKAREIAGDTKKLAKLAYVTRSHTVRGTGLVLHWSDATLYRCNKIFLRLVAERMGYIETREAEEKP